jgi:ubiquinone/menaquinone biosynthesis C-methylase UbiE
MGNDRIFMPKNHMDHLYTSRNPLVRVPHTKRLDAIVARLPTRRISVLDAGCGEGHLLERMHARLPDNDYVGVDITDVALEKSAQRVPFATLRKANLLALPFDDGSFDVIACTEVVEHVTQYNLMLAEFSRILKKGGLLFITFPNEPLWTMSRFLLMRRPVKVPDHVNSFTPRRMKKAVPLVFVERVNLPFGLPFPITLNCLMVFRKD